MEAALYPFKYMRITQRHDEGNHLPHWSPTPKPLKSDKPWDEACEDGYRSYFIAYNRYKVVEKFGSEKNGYNVRLESVDLLKLPKYEDPQILEITLTHINRDDYDKIRVGQIFEKNSKILREGTSGNATGNHFHITANIGRYDGFVKNSNNKYIFAYSKSLLPNEAFYVDTKKTTILNAKKYEFIGVNYSYGMTHKEIGKIDEFLSNEVKGETYGDYTLNSVRVFQSKNNLQATGEVDLETFNKMLNRGAKL